MDKKTAAAIERLKQSKGLAEQIMRSGDGQRLMQLLTREDGGAALDHAAKAAAKGDTQELSQLLQSLLRNPDGAAVMGRINDQAKREN
ncbi:MAG: hypothetical protein IJU66_06175 [Oscillospiraceae bacterium]|nr:hypothetical protein [Oscillospiraceae bacterium]